MNQEKLEKIVDDIISRQLGVRNNHRLIIRGYQLSDKDLDVLDRAGHPRGFDIIPHLKGAEEDYEKAGGKIRQ